MIVRRFALALLFVFLSSSAVAQQFAVGNRVWFDTDNSATINGVETGIDGVTVNLYAATDLTTSIATDVTSGGGYYLFDNLAAGDYVVSVAASNFSGVLLGYWSSGTLRTANGSIAESSAPAANGDTDSDDNGMLQSAGSLNGAVISSAVTLGPGTTTEPAGEPDLEGGNQGEPDTQANMTVDFGFYTISLGGGVWNDVDNSGTINGAETGIGGVTVELRSEDGSALLGTMNTDPSGIYLFEGLPAGNYVVRLPPVNFNPGGILRDYRSSTGPIPALPYEPGPDPDANLTDSDDNGTEANGLLGLGGYIQTSAITLTPGAEQSVDASAGTLETRVDLGVNNLPQIDLVVSKTDNQSTYGPGDTLQYDIVVTNNGPADANGMTVNDARPSQISSWTWTCAPDTPPAYNCSGDATNPSTFTDTLDLPQLTSVTYNVTAQVAPVVSGDLSNQVYVTPPSGMSDLSPGDNVATDIDTLRTVDLAVTKTDGQSSYTPGGVVNYTIVVTNNGPADATGMTVSDARPAQIASWTWTCDASTPPAYACTNDAANPATFTDSLDLPSGASVTYHVVAQVAASVSGDMTNTVQVNAPAGTQEADTSNNTATDVDTLNAVDLAVTKTDGQSSYPPAGTVQYTIVVTNNGPAAANSMTVSDARPAQIASWTWTCDAGTLPSYNCTSNAANPATFTDSLDLPSGASVTYHVTAQIAASVSGTMTNTVQVAPSGGQPELDASDNTASDVDTLAATTLSITKSSSLPVVPPGGVLTYTIQVTNTGAVSATNLTMTDALPTAVTYLSSSGDGWTCSEAAQVVTCTRALLAPGAAPPISIVVRAPAVPSSFSNTAQVSASNAAAASSGAAVAEAVVAIPSLSEWGLLLFSLMLAGVGVATVSRRW